MRVDTGDLHGVRNGVSIEFAILRIPFSLISETLSVDRPILTPTWIADRPYRTPRDRARCESLTDRESSSRSSSREQVRPEVVVRIRVLTIRSYTESLPASGREDELPRGPGHDDPIEWLGQLWFRTAN